MNHIQQHAQAQPVGFINERLQGLTLVLNWVNLDFSARHLPLLLHLLLGDARNEFMQGQEAHSQRNDKMSLTTWTAGCRVRSLTLSSSGVPERELTAKGLVT